MQKGGLTNLWRVPLVMSPALALSTRCSAFMTPSGGGGVDYCAADDLGHVPVVPAKEQRPTDVALQGLVNQTITLGLLENASSVLGSAGS